MPKQPSHLKKRFSHLLLLVSLLFSLYFAYFIILNGSLVDNNNLNNVKIIRLLKLEILW